VATVVEVFLSLAYLVCEERATTMATLVELVESIATMLLYSVAPQLLENIFAVAYPSTCLPQMQE
jgi:hypothetical protein